MKYVTMLANPRQAWVARSPMGEESIHTDAKGWHDNPTEEEIWHGRSSLGEGNVVMSFMAYLASQVRCEYDGWWQKAEFVTVEEWGDTLIFKYKIVRVPKPLRERRL